MPARLLFVGDLHLGRRYARLPGAIHELGLEASELGPAAALRRCVDLALTQAVDAVVFAGDLVEHSDDRFEAQPRLAHAMARLGEAGIAVYAVAGNHDVEVLPRLATQVHGLCLLGAGGRWQQARLVSRDGTPVRLLGWSFPQPRVSRSPLESLEVPQPEGEAVLGVLHCDVDGSARSPYAPVRASALEACPVDGWLLGHVHAPGALGGGRPIGYLGSCVALDAGEPGPRGPWLVEVEGPGRVHAHHQALSPLRFERHAHEADVAKLVDRVEDVEGAAIALVRAALEEVHARVGGAAGAAPGARVRVVLTRLEIRLPVDEASELAVALARAAEHAVETREGIHYAIEQLRVCPISPLDLEAVARFEDPPGLLARRLLLLGAGGAEADAMLKAFEERDDARRSWPEWRGLGDGSDGRDLLLEEGMRLLSRVLGEAGRMGGGSGDPT